MKVIPLKVDEVYVPIKRKKTLDLERVNTLAEDILENGLQRPIMVRKGNGRHVLIEGLHRLEAIKALGEEMIDTYTVNARQF